MSALTEAEIHRAVVNQIRYRGVEGLWCWHTPNGAYHGQRPWQGAEMKRSGVLPGVADLILVHECKNYALELKREGGTPTKAQQRYLDGMSLNGWKTAITYGLDAAIAKLEEWELLR